MSATVVADGIEVVGSVISEFVEILTPEALEFVAKLQGADGDRLGGVRREDVGAQLALRLREDVRVTAADLLTVPQGPITEQGLRININVGLCSLGSRLRGTGCVSIFNLREDVATCEISRTQIWQWIHHPSGILEDGRKLTAPLFRGDDGRRTLEMIPSDIGTDAFNQGEYPLACSMFDGAATREPFVDFLTLPATSICPERPSGALVRGDGALRSLERPRVPSHGEMAPL